MSIFVRKNWKFNLKAIESETRIRRHRIVSKTYIKLLYKMDKKDPTKVFQR